MPEAQVNGVTIHYDRQGSGEPLILIPFLTADHGCFAFQVPAYAGDFTCFAVDLRGSGATARGDAPCTIAPFADDVAGFMDAVGIDRAHVMGFSLGGAVAMRFAAAQPERTLSLSLHSTWPKTDLYVRTVVEGWQVAAQAIGDVAETAIRHIFPWCFTPELYAARPEFIQTLIDFTRSRPKQALADFLAHADAVIAHDALDELDRIKAPTHISFGAKDAVTSTRFVDPFLWGIPHAQLDIFETASHAPFFEKAEDFNARTLAFLRRHSGARVQAHAAPSAAPVS